MKNKVKIFVFLGFVLISSVYSQSDSDLDSASTKNAENPETIEAEVSKSTLFVSNLQQVINTKGIPDALLLFDTMDEELKEDFDLMLIKASLLISSSKYAEAKKVVEVLLKKNPGSIDALELNVWIAKGLNDKKAKDAAIKLLLEKDESNPLANIELARSQSESKNYSNAIKYYKKVLMNDATNIDALFGLGQASYFAERDKDCKDALNRILDIDPNNAGANLYLGKLYFANDIYSKAVVYFEKAVAADSESYDSLLDYGMCLKMLRRYDEAKAAWNKAIALNPKYFLAYAYMAGLCDELNEYAAAIENYKKVTETNPEYYYAYESIGILALREANYLEAGKAFEKAYSYNKENISYPLMISACLLRMGKDFESKQFLEKIMKAMADKKSLEFNMVRLYHDRGPSNAESSMVMKIPEETNSTKRGKMLYYFGLYFDIAGKPDIARDYYAKVAEMQAPLFFEYRLAEWGIGK